MSLGSNWRKEALLNKPKIAPEHPGGKRLWPGASGGTAGEDDELSPAPAGELSLLLFGPWGDFGQPFPMGFSNILCVFNTEFSSVICFFSHRCKPMT